MLYYLSGWIPGQLVPFRQVTYLNFPEMLVLKLCIWISSCTWLMFLEILKLKILQLSQHRTFSWGHSWSWVEVFWRCIHFDSVDTNFLHKFTNMTCKVWNCIPYHGMLYISMYGCIQWEGWCRGVQCHWQHTTCHGVRQGYMSPLFILRPILIFVNMYTQRYGCWLATWKLF